MNAEDIKGKNLYRVTVQVKGKPDFTIELRSDREGLAKTNAMVFYPYDLSGQLVTYVVSDLSEDPDDDPDDPDGNRLANFMRERGYVTFNTGGGCMAWQKDLTKDQSANAYILLTYIDVELGLWKFRDDPQWIVGRYLWTDTDESWVCCDDGLTLARALEIAALLPEPRRNEQRTVPANDLNYPMWLREFGESHRPDQEVLDLLKDERVVDQSWHNDVAPHFEAPAVKGQTVELWFYEADPNEREDEGDSVPADQRRYSVSLAEHPDRADRNVIDTLDTNNAAAAVAMFKRLMA